MNKFSDSEEALLNKIADTILELAEILKEKESANKSTFASGPLEWVYRQNPIDNY